VALSFRPRADAIDCRSPALGGSLPAMVYLPAGYARTHRRYPVVYFLHGLPAGRGTYRTLGFVAAAIARARYRAIVVIPQGARRAGDDREYLDWSPREDWPRAIAHDLPACVDRRYRTIATREGRVLAGLSAGGYGAFNIGLRHLGTFAAVESWSGYFAATNPAGTAYLDLGSPRANAAARVPRGSRLARELAAHPSYIAFYVGRSDRLFYADNASFAAALRADGIPHRYRTYPGGHATSLWAAHAQAWLEEALAYLAKIRARAAMASARAGGAAGCGGSDLPAARTSPRRVGRARACRAAG